MKPKNNLLTLNKWEYLTHFLRQNVFEALMNAMMLSLD